MKTINEWAEAMEYWDEQEHKEVMKIIHKTYRGDTKEQALEDLAAEEFGWLY